MTVDLRRTPLPDVLARLREEVRGDVVTPDDERYDRLRTVMYGGFDRRPAAIVRALDAADVAAVIDIARTSGTELAVRGGGHSNAGHSAIDGGLVLDLRELRDLDIDPTTRT
ncbi:MAG TPA: FAD-binding protein, partial [Candidatus Limnocylindrales bacterium]|nr:FAD-binding protein [Candidatus Limnocylindrales bacterium]